ncbi:methyltransferase domain-containing protein [Shinella sp. CPCC 100929]|uniref:Methyltransferase domain-containing protein n=1 Tax=Shinella lacus TaxID=2654216 RepID=A0ABT1R4B1_9HYPH|nr:methyltransferase domain-containing protein [Shinella lacus]
MTPPACNICGSSAFGDTYGKAGSAFIRKNVRCEGCGSLERHRLIFEVLRMRGLLSGNRRVLHLAPEECLATILRNRFGGNYLCGDLDPGQFSFPVTRIDLCSDLDRFAPASFDIVLHNHVLEHVACDYKAVAARLDGLLKPGGLHIFSVPFLEGGFREALDERTDDYRTDHFGQWDHMRIFSPEDFLQTLGSALPVPEEYDATRLVPAERLFAINVPEDAWRGFNNNSVFLLEKRQPEDAFAVSPATHLASARPPHRPDAVLFVSANGIGQGHLTRQLAVARRLKHRPAAFLTMSYSAGIVRDMGFPVHFVPHHALSGEEPGAWNARLATEIELLLDAYHVTTLIYDVNFVFDGIIEVLRNHAKLQAVWIRRAMWPSHHASYIGAGVHFPIIIEPDDYAAALDAGPTTTDRAKTTLVPPMLLIDPSERLERGAARQSLGLPQEGFVVLVDLSRSSNPDLTHLHGRLLDDLLARPDIHIVELKSPLTGNVAPRHPTRHRLVTLHPAYAHSRAFDAAIVRAGYNTFHEHIAGGIPTLFVPDESPDMDRQVDRARWAQERGAALMHRLGDGEAGLSAAIDRLLSADARAALTAACAAITGARWQNGADVLAGMLEGRFDGEDTE